MSRYVQWRAAQPGFLDPTPNTFTSVSYWMRKSKPIAWDGTFNMPILPLTDGQHRDCKQFKLSS